MVAEVAAELGRVEDGAEQAAEALQAPTDCVALATRGSADGDGEVDNSNDLTQVRMWRLPACEECSGAGRLGHRDQLEDARARRIPGGLDTAGRCKAACNDEEEQWVWLQGWLHHRALQVLQSFEWLLNLLHVPRLFE